MKYVLCLITVSAVIFPETNGECNLFSNNTGLRCDNVDFAEINTTYCKERETIVELKITHEGKTHKKLLCEDVPFPKLQKLEISCGVEELAVNSLNHMRQLKLLNLSNNNLQDFPEQPFKNLSLEILDVSRNQLSKIATVQYLNGLSTLNLSSNKISVIENAALNAFPNLSVLDLGQNQIFKLEENTFDGLSRLETINLTNNKFTEIPDELFCNNAILKTVVLSRNNLRYTLPRMNLSRIKHLTHLDVHLCNIKTINPLNFLKKLTNLKFLDLGNNVLSDIRVDVFDDLISVERIVMTASNLLNLLKPVFRRNLNLRYLDVSRCKIDRFGDALFSNNRELKTLNASRNNLNTLSGNIFHATSLKIIDLSYNSFSRINWRCFDIPTLDYLTLRGNRLQDLTPYTFKDTFSLKHLDLRDNGLVFVDSFLINSAKKLVTFEFTGNPFNCACLDELFYQISLTNITFSKDYYFDGSKAVCVKIHEGCSTNEKYLNEYRLLFFES